MTIIDTELPYSLVDFALSMIVTIMGAVLVCQNYVCLYLVTYYGPWTDYCNFQMCLSAGYFAITVPPIILLVWSRYRPVDLLHPWLTVSSSAKVLSENLSPNASSRSGSEVAAVLTFHRVTVWARDY